jgi:hypothetical protein
MHIFLDISVTNHLHFNANNVLAISSGVMTRELEYLSLETRIPCWYLVETFTCVAVLFSSVDWLSPDRNDMTYPKMPMLSGHSPVCSPMVYLFPERFLFHLEFHPS